MQCNSGKSATDIDKRRTELLELSSYIQTVDNDVTMILQNLQWDRKQLIEALPMASCRYDKNHRIPPDKLEGHEKECYLRSMGYSKEDLLLPDPLNANASTLVTLNKNDIQNIIDYAAKVDPGFKKGRGSKDPSEPLSLERLQHTYSTDERRAFHDAVVSAAPSCHDLSELALLSGDDKSQSTKPKSRAEIIAELRDMKRRRAKYRGAAKTKNYSDELRSVIASQMEHYSEVIGAGTKNDSNINKSNIRKSIDFRPVEVKKEPIESDTVYGIEQEKRQIASKYDRHRDGTRQRDKSLRVHESREYTRDKNQHEFRHKENYRDETHSDRRDKHTEREKVYNDYRIDRDDKRHKYSRDKYSSSSKERSRDRHEFRKSDKYADDYYKNYKSSRNTEGYTPKYDSREKYKEEKHERYYDYKDYEVAKKRIKQEKD